MKNALLLCLLVGCGASAKTSTTSLQGEAETLPKNEVENVEATKAVETAETEDIKDLGPAPAATLTVKVTSVSQVELFLRVTDGRAKIASKITLEEFDGETFKERSATMSFRSSCMQEAPSCRELVAGAELSPVAWNGFIGEGQCNCARCGSADPTKTYRMVAYSCEGHRIESPPFKLN